MGPGLFVYCTHAPGGCAPTATRCKALPRAATRCNMQHTAPQRFTTADQPLAIGPLSCFVLHECKRSAYAHCLALQHLQRTATHCNTLQHTAPHCNILQHTAIRWNTLQHTATYCNTTCNRYALLCAHMQEILATHCNTLHHTATHCSITCKRYALLCAHVQDYRKI